MTRAGDDRPPGNWENLRYRTPQTGVVRVEYSNLSTCRAGGTPWWQVGRLDRRSVSTNDFWGAKLDSTG